MKPLSRKIIVFSTLPIAVALAYWHFSSADIDNQTSQTPTPSAPVTMPDPDSSAGNPDTVPYADADWGRDPFVRLIRNDSLVPAAGDEPQWILGGILYDDKSPSAVINRKIVSLGDTVNGAMVIKIKRRSVILEIDGVAVTLDMARGKS